MAAVTICSDFGAQENKVSHYFHCLSIYLHEVMGLDAMILVFLMLSFKPAFSLSSFTFIKRLFSSSSLFAIRVVFLHIWDCWYFSWQFWFQVVIHPAQHFSWCSLQTGLSNKAQHNIALRIWVIIRWQYIALSCSFPNFEPVRCSMPFSSCCFLTHIQVSQETGKVVWYSHLFKHFPQFEWPHSQRL